MRRGHGVSAVKNRLNEKKAYSAVGKTIQENKLSHVEELISNFKTSLEVLIFKLINVQFARL